MSKTIPEGEPRPEEYETYRYRAGGLRSDMQTYVEEPMRYIEKPTLSGLHSCEGEAMDNPAPNWAPPKPPTPASTWAFVLGMVAAVFGLFLSAMDWGLMAALCLPGTFFIVRSVMDGRRGVRQNNVLLALATVGVVIGGLCAVWGYNTMQDVKDGLDCIETAETLYEMGQC
jgi:hypothetical protein